MVTKHKIIILLLLLAFLAALGAAVWFWMEIQQFEPEVYYYVEPERSFIYQTEETIGYGFEEYIKDKITTERSKLINQERSFIDVNLKKMELVLYKDGKPFETFTIQSKGKEGSFWETAPGAYFAGDKIVRHFSNVSRVWMPYAIQFYGNFFIHGWPYDNLGRPLALGPSGGCIRLLTEDAVVVFEFAERGMPILIFEEKTSQPLAALIPLNKEPDLPEIEAEAFMAADLVTGEIVLSKEIHSEIYTDAIVRGMLVLAASEAVSMEKRLMARDWMLEGLTEGVILAGRSYSLQDLVNILLAGPSEEAASVLSRFFTQEYFVAAMNAKARAIGMQRTLFVDITGFSKANKTTLFDSARMMRYIKDYRSFIFEISDQWPGKGSEGKETVFKVLEAEKDGISRHILIAVADSPDAAADLKNIISWLQKELGLE